MEGGERRKSKGGDGLPTDEGGDGEVGGRGGEVCGRGKEPEESSATSLRASATGAGVQQAPTSSADATTATTATNAYPTNLRSNTH